MTRKDLEERLRAAAIRYDETQDPEAWNQVEWCATRMAVYDSLTVLENVLAHRRDEDLQTSEVDEALKFIESNVPLRWPFQQWRDALTMNDEEQRWAQLNSALDEIRFGVRMSPYSHRP
jgi:hypothetical protein